MDSMTGTASGPRPTTAGVWAAAALVPALVVATVALHLRTGNSALTSWWLGDVLLACLLVVPGLLVSAKQPGNIIGWLLLTAAGSAAFSAAGREYLALGFLGGWAPGHRWIGWFADSTYMVSMATLPLVLLYFPDGRLLRRSAQVWVGTTLASLVLGTFGAMFYSGPAGVDVQGRLLRNPARGLFPPWLTEGAGTASTVLFLVSVVAAIALVVIRYRRSDGETRQQVRWVVWSGSIGVVELATEMIPGNRWSQLTAPVVGALISGSVCVAILKHRLFDIDVVIRRTLVYSAMSIGTAGLYVLVVSAAGLALDQHVVIGPGLLATIVAALAFGPARTRVQREVDRIFYGDSRDPYLVLQQVGRSLDSGAGFTELHVVVETVRRALRIPYAAVLDRSGRVLATGGTDTGRKVAVELTYQGRPMGRLLAGLRRDEHRFASEEMRLLDDLGRQIGAAVHAVGLSRDLQASRVRLVSAKEEERRRLRRDLHDGLGPKLAALGLKVDAAHALADEEPELSKELMSRVATDIRGTIEDIRRLVYGLRPPALDELGLVEALREVSRRFDSGTTSEANGPRITLTAPTDLRDLPAAAEVAVYGIVTEALTNAVRHAGAATCRIHIAVGDDGALDLAIRDDGTGLPDGWRPGVGTTSMRERAEELGGELTVQPAPIGHGTEVRALIPCRQLA